MDICELRECTFEQIASAICYSLDRLVTTDVQSMISGKNANDPDVWECIQSRITEFMIESSPQHQTLMDQIEQASPDIYELWEAMMHMQRLTTMTLRDRQDMSSSSSSAPTISVEDAINHILTTLQDHAEVYVTMTYQVAMRFMRMHLRRFIRTRVSTIHLLDAVSEYSRQCQHQHQNQHLPLPSSSPPQTLPLDSKGNNDADAAIDSDTDADDVTLLTSLLEKMSPPPTGDEQAPGDELYNYDSAPTSAAPTCSPEPSCDDAGASDSAPKSKSKPNVPAEPEPEPEPASEQYEFKKSESKESGSRHSTTDKLQRAYRDDDDDDDDDDHHSEKSRAPPRINGRESSSRSNGREPSSRSNGRESHSKSRDRDREQRDRSKDPDRNSSSRKQEQEQEQEQEQREREREQKHKQRGERNPSKAEAAAALTTDALMEHTNRLSKSEPHVTSTSAMPRIRPRAPSAHLSDTSSELSNSDNETQFTHF